MILLYTFICFRNLFLKRHKEVALQIYISLEQNIIHYLEK